MGVSPYKKKGHQFKVEREGASLLQSTYAICYVYSEYVIINFILISIVQIMIRNKDDNLLIFF